MNWNEFTQGLRRGTPVGMGYLSVSFGFGTLAASQGIRVLDAALISATNVTSAGQFAGLTLILAAAGLWEVILTQIIINSRYALMSLALSQRMGEKIGLLPRLFIAFMNTDEIFALAMSRKEPLTVPYLLGLGTLPLWAGPAAPCWEHWPGLCFRRISGRLWESCSMACLSPLWYLRRRRSGRCSSVCSWPLFAAACWTGCPVCGISPPVWPLSLPR